MAISRVAVILSAAMLVRHHWKMPEIADRIDKAVYDALSEGEHTANILAGSGLATVEFANAICGRLC